jgi:hypothetical protein
MIIAHPIHCSHASERREITPAAALQQSHPPSRNQPEIQMDPLPSAFEQELALPSCHAGFRVAVPPSRGLGHSGSALAFGFRRGGDCHPTHPAVGTPPLQCAPAARNCRRRSCLLGAKTFITWQPSKNEAGVVRKLGTANRLVQVWRWSRRGVMTITALAPRRR